MCTSVEPHRSVVQNPKAVLAQCPGKLIGVHGSVQESSPRRLKGLEGKRGKWKRSNTLIGGVGCATSTNSPINAISVESYRSGECSAIENSKQSLHMTCADTEHPIFKYTIISGSDAISWCSNSEAAVGGGCRALDSSARIIASEPVNVCDANVATYLNEPFPALCSGWRCQSSGNSSQVITVLCMAVSL